MANTDSQNGKTLSGLLKEKFDTQIAGKPVALYTLTNKNGDLYYQFWRYCGFSYDTRCFRKDDRCGFRA